jgi:hypothetical protein
MYRILECGGKTGKEKFKDKECTTEKARNLRIKGKGKSL